jgi:hypothetical protein
MLLNKLVCSWNMRIWSVWVYTIGYHVKDAANVLDRLHQVPSLPVRARRDSIALQSLA